MATTTPEAFAHHDHARCIESALEAAARICAEQKGRLTQRRRRVLELVWRSHEPVGAYAILEQLRAEGFSGAPPTVYRALDFLLAHGLIHRIESLNAYTGCAHPGRCRAGQFLICSRCQRVAELEESTIGEALERAASARGFAMSGHTVEVRGLCGHCQKMEGQR